MSNSEMIDNLKKLQNSLKEHKGLSDTDLVSINDKVANILASVGQTESKLLGEYVNNGLEVHDYLISGRQSDLTPDIKTALSKIKNDNALYLFDGDDDSVTKVTQAQLINIISDLISSVIES